MVTCIMGKKGWISIVLNMSLIMAPVAARAEATPAAEATVAAPIALASCRSEVSYKWSKAAKEGAGEEQVVFFAMIEQRAETSEKAKSKLAEIVAKEKGKATERCRQEHQNKSRCVATRFDSNSSVMTGLGFSARKALEQAIDSDCSAVQGVCGAVSASEPECKEPEKKAEDPAAAAPADAKKDAKKKK